ncbi:MAG: SCO family protein [Burkholderiaceae bacterium]|nr:SCO family protein [Burkholderiaceae bacterium]
MILNKRTLLQFAIKSVAALAVITPATAMLMACTENKPQFKAIDITGADYAKDFAADGAMIDHNGQPRSIKDFAGKVVVLFFGYTQCPDVCPTSMAELAEVKKLLGKDGDKLQGLFITIDPERDTPDVLKAYMVNFDPTFLAMRTTPDKLATVAKDFKTYYKKAPGRTDSSYTMDHSAGSYVYDTHGKVRLYTRYGSGAAALASDIALLLK